MILICVYKLKTGIKMVNSIDWSKKKKKDRIWRFLPDSKDIQHLTWWTWPHFYSLKIWENIPWSSSLIPCSWPLLTQWSPVCVRDAPYLSISTSPWGPLPLSQLHVTPTQLKVDSKASPKRPETEVTAGIRKRERGDWKGEVDEKKNKEKGKRKIRWDRRGIRRRVSGWKRKRAERRKRRMVSQRGRCERAREETAGVNSWRI